MSQNLNAPAVDARPLQELVDLARTHCSKRGASVVIYGPGAVDTPHAEDFCEHYQCGTAVADWRHNRGRHIPRDAILLAHRRPAGPFAIPLEIVNYAAALRAIGLGDGAHV